MIQLNYLNFSGAITFFFCLVEAYFVYFKRDNNPISNTTWALCSLLIASWGFGLFWAFTVTDPVDVLFWSRYLNLSSFFIPVFFLHFACAFLNQVDKRKKLIIFAYVSTAIYFISCIIFKDLFIPTVSPTSWFFLYPDAGPLYYIYPLQFSLFVNIGIFFLFVEYRRTKDVNKKNQIWYLFIAMAIGLLGGGTTFFQVFDIPIFPFGANGLMFMVLILSYAITKHSLMDMSVVISRSLAYLVMFGLVLTSSILSYYLVLNYPSTVMLVLIAQTYVWALYGSKILLTIQTAAEFKWIKGAYDTSQIIANISRELSGEVDRSTIFETVVKEVTNQVQIAKYCTYVGIRDDDDVVQSYEVVNSNNNEIENATKTDPIIAHFQSEMHLKTASESNDNVKQLLNDYGFMKLDQTILIPLYSPEHLEGVVILGPRISEQKYTEEDLSCFEQAVAVVSAFLYRLTPYEKIEKKYFDTQKKVHDAEVMDIQSKKNEGLAHVIQEYNHEIRTPLQAIMTYAEYLPDDEASLNMADLIDAKEVILKNAERANDIVSTTLQLSEQNFEEESRGNKEVVHLKDLVKSCITNQTFPDNVITLTRLRKDLAVTANRSSIEKVLMNLLKNAKEAMPEGGEITITVNETGDEGSIEIKDTGVGISKDRLQKIWEPYQSSHVTKGRGLGLSIVHKIVSDNEGRITVDSEEGVGTTFTVYLKKTTES